MYKDKEKQKTVTAERVRRYRALRKEEGVTSPCQAQGVTLGVTSDEGVTVTPYIPKKVDLKAHKVPVVYPPLVYALADPVKRAKLQTITNSLKAHSQLDNVYYGVSGVTFKTVSECLECTA